MLLPEEKVGYMSLSPEKSEIRSGRAYRSKKVVRPPPRRALQAFPEHG